MHGVHRGRPPSPPVAAALAALLALAVAPPLDGQTVVGRVLAPAGSGEGVAPVRGAAVTLLDGALRPVRQTSTDEEGAFVLEADSAGSWAVLVASEGFATHLSAPVVLGSDVLHEERIVVERVRASGARAGRGTLALREGHLLEMCGSGFRPESQGVLVGVLVARHSGLPVAGARAVAEWDGGSWRGPGGAARPERLEIPAGDEGLFVFCGVPAGVEMRLRGVAPAGPGEVVAVRIEAGDVRRLDIPVPGFGATAPPESAGDGAGSVLGRVTDWATGEVVEAAEVTLTGSGRTAVTDANGRFVFEDVPAGRHVLAVHHVAFPHQQVLLPVRAGAGHDVDVRLVAEAIPLAPLRVTIRSTRWFRDMRGFTERARRGIGHFITPEQIRAREPGHLLDLVRTVPGVRAASAGGTAGGTSFLSMRGHRCAPAVWVDRTPWRSGDPFMAIRAADLEAVEVYRGLTEIPAQFLGPSDACGAVVVWTRKVRPDEIYSSAR